MQSYETIDLTLPTMGIDLFTNHLTIPIACEPCFLGDHVCVYEKAIQLCCSIIYIHNSLQIDYDNDNDNDNDQRTMLAFGEYKRQPRAREFFSHVYNSQSDLVKDWNQFRDNVTLSCNMGFVGVCEDSSNGAAAVMLGMLLKFGVIFYNQQETWSIYPFAKLCRLYCFGDRKTLKNSSACIN